MSGRPEERLHLPAECREAEALGIDVTLILENLEMKPSERLKQLQTMISLHERIQRRTISESLLEKRDRMKIEEKLRILGPEEKQQ